MHEARFAGTCQDQHGLSFLNLLVGTWQQAKVTGLGPASTGLGPGLSHQFFVVLKKTPGRAGEGVGDG